MLPGKKRKGRNYTCSALTTSMMTPPFNIWARPALTLKSTGEEDEAEATASLPVDISGAIWGGVRGRNFFFFFSLFFLGQGGRPDALRKTDSDTLGTLEE